MASMSIKRCLALPVTLAENTIYIVLTDKAGEVQLYVTGHTGDVVRKTLSTTDVAEMIESSLQSNGIITVETLPTPYVSALAESRSLTLQDLMARIGLKIEAAARLQGTQHATESLVEAASSEEEIDAIVMPVL